jgi:hypothetical protein
MDFSAMFNLWHKFFNNFQNWTYYSYHSKCFETHFHSMRYISFQAPKLFMSFTSWFYFLPFSVSPSSFSPSFFILFLICRLLLLLLLLLVSFSSHSLPSPPASFTFQYLFFWLISIFFSPLIICLFLPRFLLIVVFSFLSLHFISWYWPPPVRQNYTTGIFPRTHTYMLLYQPLYLKSKFGNELYISLVL